jgi:hypothetical protein
MPEIIKRLVRRFWFDRFPVVWLRDTRRMRKLVNDFAPSRPAKQEAIHIGVVLMPWCGSAVPWFSLVCGLLLAANGNKVSFILDDMPFGKDRGWRLQLACIRSVLKLLRGRHQIIALRDHVAHAVLTDSAQRSIERLATLNVVWAQRGEMNVPAQDLQQIRQQLSASHGPIAHVLQSHRFDALFVPGGVWGSSGIWIEHARAIGVRVATYDSGGYGMLLLSVNGIACQLQDIPQAFSLLKARPNASQEQAFLVESALAEIGKRRAGVDKFSSQVQGAQRDPRFAGAVLIALNSPWDSAALGLHVVFESTQQWIVETARYLLENTSAPVIVRQHPVERLEIARGTDDYRGLLARHFGNHPRLHFVAAEDPVNSYDLLEQVAAVVVYTSTIGIEAAAHGKPVVTESSSYYADLGFVRKAANLEQYREFLFAAVSCRSVVTPAMRDDALACYYLTQCCNWVTTPFNVPGFHEWSLHDLRQLAQEKSVRTVVRALEENIPVAFLNHLARLEHQAPVS